MGQVVEGARVTGGSQPSEMVEVVESEDDAGMAPALALVGVLCLIVLAASHLLGTVDLTEIGWIDVGFGAAALASVGGIGVLRTVTKTTDRLDACEQVEPGVQLDTPGKPRSRFRHVAGELRRAAQMGVAMLAGIALLSWADDGDAAHWALAGCGLMLGVTIQVVVRDRLVLGHQRTEGVRVFRPDDPDGWYKQATGKELDVTDPGPLFHLPREG